MWWGGKQDHTDLLLPNHPDFQAKSQAKHVLKSENNANQMVWKENNVNKHEWVVPNIDKVATPIITLNDLQPFSKMMSLAPNCLTEYILYKETHFIHIPGK